MCLDHQMMMRRRPPGKPVQITVRSRNSDMVVKGRMCLKRAVMFQLQQGQVVGKAAMRIRQVAMRRSIACTGGHQQKPVEGKA